MTVELKDEGTVHEFAATLALSYVAKRVFEAKQRRNDASDEIEASNAVIRMLMANADKKSARVGDLEVVLQPRFAHHCTCHKNHLELCPLYADGSIIETRVVEVDPKVIVRSKTRG